MAVTQPEDELIRHIPLSKGLFSVIDVEDFERVSAYNWYAIWNMDTRYIAHYGARNETSPDGKRRIVKLHRFIMGLDFGDKRVVDHINGDTLDNRRINLRICSVAENNKNRHPRSTGKRTWSNTNKVSLGHSGIKKSKDIGFGFDVFINYNRRRIHVGWRETEGEAEILFAEALKKYEQGESTP